jgi:lysophospholipase L1-like esterase
MKPEIQVRSTWAARCAFLTAIVLGGAAVLVHSGAAVQSAAMATVESPSTAASRLNEPAWAERHETKLQMRSHDVDLLFLGDSITQNFERIDHEPYVNYRPIWNYFYGDRKALNLGFSGDTTGNLLWRIQNGELDGMSPRATVLLIGTNNTTTTHRKWTASQDAAAIGSIVGEVHQQLPMTHIVLAGILPSGQSAWKSSMTEQINSMLQERFARGQVPYVSYVDLTPVFIRNGKLDEDLFVEPRKHPPQGAVHPTAAGQAALAAALEPTIAQWLHVPPKAAMPAVGN